jgi:hypothetical protein
MNVFEQLRERTQDKIKAALDLPESPFYAKLAADEDL